VTQRTEPRLNLLGPRIQDKSPNGASLLHHRHIQPFDDHQQDAPEMFSPALDMLENAIGQRPVSARDQILLTMLVALVRRADCLDEAGRQEMIEAIGKLVPAGFS
jgi:hypothetical protein